MNLQAHCADLFHFDIPWNPARMEQRNGRIDRTLQPAEVVRCHYFVYPDRSEDRILATVVRKVETVRRELGSLGQVVLENIGRALEKGIRPATQKQLETIEPRPSETVAAELEASRVDREAMRAEVERAAARLERSRRHLEVEPDSLRGVVEVGLRLAGAEPLREAGRTGEGRPLFELPALDRSWDSVLDSLRPPRARGEDFWAWRRRPPRPVTFHPLESLTEEVEQLHLAHPFVRRILDRFLAQGFGAHDLSRVSAVVAPGENVIRVVAYGRLTLFGPSATRLHDQIVPLVARWSERAVQPYKDKGTAHLAAIEKLLAQGGRAPNATLRARILGEAGELFAALWPHLRAEAEALAAEARQRLGERARREAEDLRKLLLRQGEAIHKAKQRLRQMDIRELRDRKEQRQVELDLQHLDERRHALERELESEPQAIRALYEVRMQRLSPVGLVVAWPEAMT